MSGHTQAADSRGWSVSLRTFVTGVMLAALLPLLAHVLLGTWYSYVSTRQWAEADLVSDAEHLARDIDRRLDLASRIMKLVAEAPAMRQGLLPTVRDHLDLARTQGLVKAAIVRGRQGEVLLAVGLAEAEAAGLPAATSDDFRVGLIGKAAVLVASWPVSSNDPRLARLDYVISLDPASILAGMSASWPWHVSAVADREGHLLWPDDSGEGRFLPEELQRLGQAGGVVHDWASPDGDVHINAFAHAPRSGLTVGIGQVMPALYERVPFGPVGAIGLSVVAALVSMVLARVGAMQIQRAYRGAVGGWRPGRVRIEDADRLGADLRQRRDRLFQATGGIAVVELSRPPGTRWQDGQIAASSNLRALLGLPADCSLSFDMVTEGLDEADRAALQAMGADGPVPAFGRVVQVRHGDGIRDVSIVGLMREPIPGLDDELVLTLQDVTPQKDLERALQTQASRLRMASELAGLGIWERDLQHDVGYASDRLWEIVGLAPRSAIDMPDYLQLVHPEDRERVRATIARVNPDEISPAGRLHGAAHQIRYRILRPDGGIRHVRASRRFVTDAAGQPERVVGVMVDETEAVLAQRALETSEAQLRLAVDTAAMGVFSYDPATREGHWSDRMWRMRGLAPEPTLPAMRDAASLVHPDDRARVLARIRDQEAQPDGVPVEMEYRILWPDGSVHHLLSRAVTQRDAEGRVLRIFGINLDVTEQRLAEQSQAERSAILELAMDAGGLGFWHRDMERNTGTLSPRIWSLLGLPARDGWHTREEFLSAVHPDDRARVQRDWVDAVDEGDGIPTAIEYRVRWPDGSVRHLSSRRALVRCPEGHVLRVVGITADVTEARRATQDLADSEARMRLAVEAADIGIFEFDAGTMQGYWSDRTWRMRGLEPKQAIPTFAETEAMVHPEDRARAIQARDQQIASPDGTVNEHEYRVVWPDGRVRHLLSRCITRRAPDGGLLKVAGINIDVTALRQADLLIARSEARFRLAIETVQLGVWDYDAATGETVWSDRMWEIRGLPAVDAPVTMDDIVATTHPDDRTRMEALVREQWTGLRPGPTETEYRVLRPDGSERLVLSRSMVIHDRNGRVQQVIGVNRDITDQRNAEVALRENEALFRLAIETASLGVYQMDMPDRTGVWSERMYTMRGLAPRPGMPPIDEMMEMVHPEDREALLANRMAHRTRSSGDVSQYEFRVVWPDGTVRHLLARAFPVRDEAGVLRKIIGVNQDITEQKQAEQELRDNAVRFRLAIQAAGLAVWEWQVPSGIRHWSPEMWALRGLPPREEGPTDPELMATVHPDDRARAAEFLENLRTNPGEPTEGEYRVVRPDGVARYIHLRTTALRNAEGRVLRVTGVAADVTERHLATLALQESESLFRLAAEAASQGVWDRDQRTGTVRWSQRMWSIYGLAPRETPPSRAEWETLLHPDDLAEALAMFARLTAHPGHHVESMQCRIVWPNGQVRHLDTRAMSVRNEAGALTRLIGVVVDITEAQELRAQATIAGNVATLGQLAGGIAHELAQPLQAIIAAADTAVLRLGIGSDAATLDDAREKLSSISKLAARAGKTIQHLLAFSRGTSSSGATKLPDAVSGALELVGRNLLRAQVDVAVDLPADLPVVLGGIVEIEQVLVNLLLNARDALEHRPVRRIEIRAHRQGDAVVLTLADTGAGIPANVVSRIFDPFFTTKPAGKGTGLGLAISQKTMVALGGSIAVHTTAQGTHFTLVFQTMAEGAPG